MSGRYDDIIDLPHPVSQRHPQMPLADRAAQFSPFAALTGLDAALQETARLTDQRITLDEYEQAELDKTLQALREAAPQHPAVQITYFQPDTRKAGGQYVTSVGHVKRIAEYEQQLILTEGTSIPWRKLSRQPCNK